MKAVKHFSLFLCILFLPFANAFAGSTPRGGLTVEIHLYQEAYGYFFFPWLSTNATPPGYPDGDYYITSPQVPTNGCSANYRADTNGVSNSGGGASTYPTIDLALDGITNGSWSIWVTNTTSTNHYTFEVSTVGIDDTFFPLGPAIVIYPAGFGFPGGDTNFPSQPNFTWIGPTNWTGQLSVNVDHIDDFGNEFELGADTLDPSTTNWPCPTVLPNGTNAFNVLYLKTGLTNFVSTTPVDASLNPISSWDTTGVIDSSYEMLFKVGPPEQQGVITNFGHTLVASYNFDDSGNAGADSSGDLNDIYCGSSWGTNVHIFTSDTAAGDGAVEFFGDSSMTPCDKSFLDLTNILVGSYSVSMWINTTSSVGNDDDELNDYSGQSVIFLNNSDQGSIPFGLTGNKGAFSTGSSDGTINTLHTTQDINTGSYVHVVVTRDQRTGEKKIYINGELDASGFGVSGLLKPGYYLSLGGTYSSAYHGVLDQVQFYAGVIGSNDVAFLYQNPASTAPNVRGSDLQAHYDFDGDAVQAVDVSRNGNDVIVANGFDGGTISLTTSAKVGTGAIVLDGLSYITPSTNLVSTIAGDFSISLWLNTTQSYGNEGDFAWEGAAVVSADIPTSAKDIVPMALTGGQVAFNTGDGFDDETLNSTVTVNDGTWHHVVVTRNQASGLKRIFIDGVLNAFANGTTELLNDPVMMTIGSKTDASDPDPYFSEYAGGNFYIGSLDDIQFYDRDLTVDEVASLYATPGSTIDTINGITNTPPPEDMNAALNTTNLTWSKTGDSQWFAETAVTHDGIQAAQSGVVTNGQTSILQTSVTGPATLSFYWKAVRVGYSFNIDFFMDNNYVDSIYYPPDWERMSGITIGPGTHSLMWRASSDEFTDPADTGYLDQVTLSSEYMPIITSYPGSQTTQLGSSVTFTGSVVANPPADLYWLKNGTKIPGETNSTLTITNAQFSDAAYYQLFASNYLGTAATGYANLRVYQPTDLIPLSITLPPVITSGALVPLVWTVTNTGPGAVSNTVDQFDFSTPVITPDFQQGTWTSIFVNKFTPAASTYTMSNYTRFANVPAGTYSIVLGVDSFGQVIETDESNNKLTSATFTVINPDMQPGELKINATNIAGGPVQFTYNITNNGPGVLDGQFWADELYISTNSVYDSSAIAIKQINPPTTIPVGQFISVTNTVTMPLITSGGYYLHLRVDNFGFQDVGNVIEANESNNIVSIPIHLIGADLVPTNIVVAANVSTRQRVPVQWMIQNQGDAPATNFNAFAEQWIDKLFLSTNQLVDSSAIQLGGLVYQSQYANNFPWPTSLAPGAAMTNLQTVAIPNVPQGNYNLLLAVDSLNEVKELIETNNLFVVPISVLNPDLKPIDFSGPPSANAHATIQLTWNVANQGAGAAYPNDPEYIQDPPPWVDRIYVSTNSTFDNTATLLGEFGQTNVIVAGTNYFKTNTVSLPGLASGMYYLILFVDGSSYVYESNETNNYRSIPILVDSPDLAATGLIIPASVSSQQPFSPIYSVKNLSSVIAFPTWSDRLYLSTDAIFDTNDIPLGDGNGIDFLHNTPLSPGDSYTNLINTGVPAVPAGDYYVLARADASQFFNEPNFGNNVIAQPIHISNPDLVASNFNAPTTITITQGNESINLDWTVVNQGAGTAYPNWSDYVYISRTNVLDTNAVGIGGGSGGNSPIAPGNNYVGFATPSLPAGLQGHYYLILQVNGSGALYESSSTNNIIVRPFDVVIPPLPIISIASVSAPVEAWSGQQIEVTWVLTNSGNAAVTHPFTDSIYLTSSPSGASPQPYGNFPFADQILPGQSVVRKQIITLPINLQGTFWVSVQTDVNSEIFQFTYRTNEYLISPQSTLVHLTPTPNLTIASIQSPTNAFSGGPVQVSWIVTNNGAGPTRTPYWYDAVYLSASTNANDRTYFQFVGFAPNASFLNPGDSYANAITASLPRGLDGTYYFLVKADWLDYVFETNKTDNFIASGPIVVHLTPPPDLQVTSVIPPHNAFSGQPITVTWAVTNKGLGQMQPTETQWYDRVYICQNNFLDGSAREIGTFRHIGPLDPDQGYITTVTNAMLPIGVAGDFYVIVQSDIFNQVYEGAFEDNNDTAATFATHITLTPPPDLVTTILQSPSTALASHNLAVTYTVANQGATATPNPDWNDILFVCTTNVFNPNKVILSTGLGHYGIMQPGDSYTQTIKLTLPDDLTGTNYVFVVSDYYDQVFELDNTNNIGVGGPVAIISRPADLTVNAFQSPSTVNVVSTMQVSWVVTNIGVGDTAVNQWNDRLILTPNALLGSPSDVALIDLTHHGILDTNGSYTVQNQTVTIPPTVSPGQYNLFLVADFGGNVYESTNKINNVYGPVPITVTPHSADLLVTSASAPTSAFSGTTVPVTFTVKNAGDLPPNNGYWLDTVYLTTDGALTSITPLLTYERNPKSLQPGESYQQTLNVPLPANANGDYYFVVLADGFGYVNEPGAKFNNIKIIEPPIHITPSPAPDLTVTQVIAPANAYEGQPFNMSWVVKNIGTVAATADWIDVAYLSLDQVFDPRTDIYLGFSNRVSALAPGESYTNTANFIIPQGLSGPFEVFVAANFRGEINENGATLNNFARAAHAMQVDLLPPVDLVAGLITIPVNGSPGHQATITYTVTNQGQNAALGQWEDSLYISADTNWDVGDPLFARVLHKGDLQPGQTYTNSATNTLPGVVPGNYYVIVRSDILNHLVENNKSNNIGASLDSIVLDVPVLTLGTPSGGSIGSGQTAYYKFAANAGDTIRIKMTTGALLADNEIFLKREAMPTSGDFDFAANNPFTADPEMFVPIAQSGTYYLQLYSQYMPVLGPYTILAEVLPFTVANVQPTFAHDGGETTFKIQGALFDTFTQFHLAGVSNTITAKSIFVENSTLAYVTFNTVGAVDGNYDLQAAMISNQTNLVVATLSNAVTIFEGVGPVADASIDGPLVVSVPSGRYLASVLYGNSGDADLASPLIMIQGAEATPIGFSRDHLRTNTMEVLGRSLTGPPNIMRPQASDSVQIYDAAPFHVVTFPITTTDSKPLTENDWMEIESSLRPDSIIDASWNAFWTKIRTRAGDTWGDYVKFVNTIALQFPAEQRDVRAMIGFLYTNQPGFQASSSLSGTVLGSVDNLPQTNVEVTLFSIAPTTGAATLVAAATTDGNGQFAFPHLAAGQYTYGIDADTSVQFDMDRDLAADIIAPTVTISSTSDLTQQTLYLFQHNLGSKTNDADATLVLDSQGLLHSFWNRNGALWHSHVSSGQWIDAEMISSNNNAQFAVATSPNLIDGSSPGIILVWATLTTNSQALFYSVGQNVSGGFQWSQPVQLTADPLINANPSIAVLNNGTAIISYLKVASGRGDDPDVYWSAVNISSGALLWNNISHSTLTPIPHLAFEADTNSISIKYEKEVKFEIGSQYDFSAKFKLSGKGAVGQCNATLSGSGGLDLAFVSPQYVFTGSGQLDISAAWQIDPDQCGWEFKNLTLGASGSVHGQLNNAIPQLLGIIPQLRPPAEAFNKMTDWLRARGVLLQNSVSVGVGLSYAGLSWTAPPPPYQKWRTPDEPGRALVIVDCGLTIGARLKGSKEEVWNETLIPEGEGEHVNQVNAFVQTTNGINTNDFGTAGSGNYLGASGDGKITIAFEVYPNFHTRNVTFAGSLKVSYAPKWSYTLPLGGTIVIGDKVRKPRFPSPTDPLPDGWTFTYDPSLFVGSTNVYGNNAVLRNVGSDLYQDGAPSLALDPSGTVYQAWYKNIDPYATNSGSQLVVADFNGSSWNDPVSIPNSLGLNKDVRAITDGTGHRMVVWEYADVSNLGTNATYQQVEAARASYDVYYSTFDGSNWSAPSPVATTAGLDDDVQLSAMANGNILAMWVYTDSTGSTHLVSSTWNGSSWTVPSEIATGPISGPSAQQVGTTTYLLWNQDVNTNHDTAIYQASNSGSGWSSVSLFDPPQAVSAQVHVPAPKLASIDDTINGLKALASVTIDRQKVCCKCANHLQIIGLGPKNNNCGVASIDYDYENCRKTFTFKSCVRRSSDPNDIIGPDGFGPDHWVSSLNPLDYTVDFFNDPAKASAPAKIVTITVPLDASFDTRTFRLGKFGFAGQIFTPPKTAFYQTRLDLVQAQGFYLDVFAGLDVANRQAFWTFTTIDPATGDVPINPNLGFLPPNTNSPNGEAFVTYSITPNNSTVTGTKVGAQATIVFDNQAPVPTTTYYNNLESDWPTSVVHPLPGVTVNTLFNVSWSGTGATNGDGLASYDIYVSRDGTNYSSWLEQTALNQAPFLGQPGSTYYFFSRAHGNSGNVEPTHPTFDASIFVSTNAAPSVVSTNIIVAPEQLVLLQALASDTNGDSFIFNLDTNAPTGAGITSNGLFSWKPPRSYAETTNQITIFATDNGLPPLSGSNVFTVTVGDYLEITLGSTNLLSGASASLPIYVASSTGITNVSFKLRVPENLISNFTLTATAPQLATSTLVDEGTNLNLSFTTTAGQSLLTTQQVALLNFTDTAQPMSAVVWLMPTNIAGLHTNGVVYSNHVANAGSVVLVHAEPVVQATMIGTERFLQVYGQIGKNYEVQSSINLNPPNWQPLQEYTQTDGVILIPINATGPAVFYRLLEK